MGHAVINYYAGSRMKRHLNPISVVAIIICVWFAGLATVFIPYSIIVGLLS